MVRVGPGPEAPVETLGRDVGGVDPDLACCKVQHSKPRIEPLILLNSKQNPFCRWLESGILAAGHKPVTERG